jgi:uncharacterized membrane protein YhiD involved in acid resistance
MRALEGSDRWFADYSFGSIVLSLLLAFVLGQVIAWVYAWSHSGLSYSRSFTQSLLLMTIVVSLVMYVIGNSIITAFGLLGALALIRFRNVLKDTRDTVFVFIALVVGMSVGSQRYMTAIVGTAAMILVIMYLNWTSFGTMGRYDGYLTCRLASDVHEGRRATDGKSDLSRLLGRFCRAVKLISTRQSGDEDESEFVYQIGLRDRERSGELVGALRETEGVRHVSFVMRSELSEV